MDLAYGLGVSPLSTIVYGYGNRSVTLQDLDGRWSWKVLHPELKRRHLAMFFGHPGTRNGGNDASGKPILHSSMGVGQAGRSAGESARRNFWTRWSRAPIPGRPSRRTPEGRAWLKRGKAPLAYPGSSVHEADVFDGKWGGAVDTVGWQDGWQVRNASRYGLKTFANVNNEPWHTQALEFPNSKSAVLREHRAGKQLKLWELPVYGPVTGPQGETCDCDALKPVPVEPGPAPEFPPFDPAAGRFGLWPLNGNKPKLSRKLAAQTNGEPSEDEFREATRYLQGVLNQNGAKLTVDGLFGRKTEKAVRAFQKARGLTVDGWVGPQTWRAVDRATAPAKPVSAKKRQTLSRTRNTHMTEDIKYLQTALKVQGLYPYRVDGDFGPKTEEAVKQFQRRNRLKVDGWVGPQTWNKINQL